MAKSTTKLISLKNYVITIKDATAPTPLALILTIDAGNFKFSESKSYTFVKNKGLIIGKMDNDEEPASVSFTTHFGEMISDGAGGVYSPRDILHGIQVDGAIDFVSTADVCEAYAVDITMVPKAGCTGETITLSAFRMTNMQYDAKARTLAVSGQCPAGPVFTTA